MIIAGHQPNYLPYLGFFHKITMCDMFVIVDTVQYVKRGPFGWINRNKIRTSGGKDGWVWLTVPVLSKGKFTQDIIDTMVDNSKPWSHKHWRSIEVEYQKAPYFHEHKEFFRQLYERKTDKLADLNESIIRYLISAFGIKVEITKTSVLGAQGKGDELIIDMCKRLGADSYVHGRHGKDYINPVKFDDNKIKCIYQDFTHPVYKQLHEPFMPEMAAIDLLFNHGPESLKIIKGD
jgi:hypothetical protein